MQSLSLFTGAGGDLLGSILLGWRPVGYVEKDEYCQRIIAQRIRDGYLPNAPLFGDIRTFLGDGYAASYTGLVDIITAGFPCQPFSNAGKRAGEYDERNMWPETIECIRVVRPGFCLLENVPGLISSGYFSTILGDLAASGYDARWRILSAAEVGAPHKRDRLWICAYDSRQRRTSGGISIQSRGSQQTEANAQWMGTDVDNSKCNRWDTGWCNHKENDWHEPTATNQHSGDVANAESAEREWRGNTRQRRNGFTDNDMVSDATSARFQDRRNKPMGGCEKRVEIMQSQRSDWWEIEPAVGRVANGVAHRVDRLKAIGNGQVPAVAAKVWELLTEGL